MTSVCVPGGESSQPRVSPEALVFPEARARGRVALIAGFPCH